MKAEQSAKSIIDEIIIEKFITKTFSMDQNAAKVTADADILSLKAREHIIKSY